MDVRASHTCISVASLDAAKEWYERAFGFVAGASFAIPGVGRATILQTPGGAGLELFEVPASADGIAWQDPQTSLQTRGYGHVAFEVDDLEAVFAAVTADGATPVWEPTDGAAPGLRIAFVHDPEGNLIELQSFGPSA